MCDELPPRRKTLVNLPGPPCWTTSSPGVVRISSSTEVFPRASISSRPMTLIELPTVSNGVSVLVAVTMISSSLIGSSRFSPCVPVCVSVSCPQTSPHDKHHNNPHSVACFHMARLEANSKHRNGRVTRVIRILLGAPRNSEPTRDAWV